MITLMTTVLVMCSVCCWW